MLLATHIAHMVASLFMEIVGKIHGLPRILVSDHDPLFLFIRSKFKIVIAHFYKIESTIFFTLIIFRLEIPLIKKRECINKQSEEMSINDKNNFGKKL